MAARAVVFRFLPPPPSVTDKASGAADKGKPRVTVGRKAMGPRPQGCGDRQAAGGTNNEHSHSLIPKWGRRDAKRRSRLTQGLMWPQTRTSRMCRLVGMSGSASPPVGLWPRNVVPHVFNPEGIMSEQGNRPRTRLKLRKTIDDFLDHLRYVVREDWNEFRQEKLVLAKNRYDWFAEEI